MIRMSVSTALGAVALSALSLSTLALPALAQTAASAPVSAAKKELVKKVLLLQQPGYESIARGVVERPALQLMQAAGQALQTQVPPEKREELGKSIEADVKKFVDESVPLLRDRAVKLAPSTFGTLFEEKFTEDELKQLIAWTESPVNKKFQAALPELQNGFVQKLIAEAAPLLDPKLQALQTKIRTTLGVTPPPPAPSGPRPATPAPAASGKK